MADLLKRIRTDDAPKAIGPYSQAIVAGDWVFTAGQIALDPTSGELVDGGVAAETDRVLRNLKAVLEAAGASLDTVVKTTVFLADLGDYGAVNEVYGRYFTAMAPARSAVQVAALPKGARVEIEAVARRA
jgi:2-iminobutanoate/2-iminopropanoate deaminase